MGRFQAADRGTLFLDEIGDLPLELQPKLLRALQEKQFELLGGGHTLQLDMQFIAATNQDLGRMVQERKFRADLYYRLNVFPMTLLPLREPGEDIPAVYRNVQDSSNGQEHRRCREASQNAPSNSSHESTAWINSRCPSWKTLALS